MAHAGVTQALGEAVEVRVLTLDEGLARLVDVGDRDGSRCLGNDDLDQLLRERVDQPGLAARHGGHMLGGVGEKGLTGVGGVLAQQLAHLDGREVPQGEGSIFDVERAGGLQAPVAARRRHVVTHVSHTDEADG